MSDKVKKVIWFVYCLALVSFISVSLILSMWILRGLFQHYIVEGFNFKTSDISNDLNKDPISVEVPVADDLGGIEFIRPKKTTPWFFPIEIQAPPRGTKWNFLLFMYSFQIYQILNIGYFVSYPFLLAQQWFINSADMLTDYSVSSWINWFFYKNYFSWVIVIIPFWLGSVLLKLIIFISAPLASFVEKMYDLDETTKLLKDPFWLINLGKDTIELFYNIILSPFSQYLGSIWYFILSPILVPLEFLFNKTSVDFILGGCFLYPIGLILICFLCVSALSFFNDSPKDRVSDLTIVSEVNRWYKNLLIFKILIVYNSLFLLYFLYHIVVMKFEFHKSFIYSRVSDLCFISFDRYSMVNLMLIILFTIIFIKISFSSLSKFIDLNTTILFILSILCLFILVQLSDIFLVYLGIVALSLCIYPLITLDKKSHGGVESVSKYFFLGGLASGIMLYGISLIYRELNTLSYQNIKALDFTNIQSDGAYFTILIGFLFIIFGFFFKLSIVPLQNWTPDVYLGSPTAITCFLATVVKFGVYCSFFRFYYSVLLNFFSANLEFKNLMLVFSLASILIGAVGAIDQFKIKRFIGFTTINQMGFILLGVSLQHLYGFVASYVYLCIYTVLNLIFFLFILNIKINGKRELIYMSDLALFFKTNKLASIFFILLLFSLAGMPPTIGFYMKLLILKSLIITGHIKLTVIILYANVASILYYVRMIKIIFFDAEALEYFEGRSVNGNLIKSSNKPSTVVSFTFFKGPLTGIKNLHEILGNKKLAFIFFISIIRQIFYYLILLIFLSGVWYNSLVSDYNFSQTIAFMWADLNSVSYDSVMNGGINDSIYNFLKVI